MVVAGAAFAVHRAAAGESGVESALGQTLPQGRPSGSFYRPTLKSRFYFTKSANWCRPAAGPCPPAGQRAWGGAGLRSGVLVMLFGVLAGSSHAGACCQVAGNQGCRVLCIT